MTAQKKAGKPTPKPKATKPKRTPKPTKVSFARLRSDKPLTEHEEVIARLDAILAVVYEISGLQERCARGFFKDAYKMIWENHRSAKSSSKHMPEAISGVFYR